MNSRPVYALPEVAGDLIAAAEHYESWRSDGREELLRKYDETAGWIAWNPDLFPRKFGAVRRALLKQSHYVVYFIVEPERTLIVAVLDGRREPAEIRRTLGGRRRRAR